ncbi:MAG: hypothetical protein AAAC47_16155 [Pararhizobium sp.]
MRHLKNVIPIGWDGSLVSVRKIREENGSGQHIYYFRSPKNNRLFIFCGVIPFVQAVLLEGTPDIASYTALSVSNPRDSAAEKPHELSCLVATRRNGQKIVYEPRHVGNGPVAPRSQSDADLVSRWRDRGWFDKDTAIQVVTDRDLRKRFVQLDNWLMLCAAMNRVANRPLVLEQNSIQLLLEQESSCTVDAILNQAGMDAACMFAALAHGLASDTLACDTAQRQLVRNSVVTRGGKRDGQE